MEFRLAQVQPALPFSRTVQWDIEGARNSHVVATRVGLSGLLQKNHSIYRTFCDSSQISIECIHIADAIKFLLDASAL
jgi:hypothetical protein